MDADTGQILHQSEPDKSVHPASLTKVMTLIMVFDALEKGQLSLRDNITVSRHAAGMQPSKLGLKPGSTIRVKDAIYALVTKSANDIAVAMAEHIAGSENNFARMMTAKARGLGMDHTLFRNASGLHDPYQVTTARDMAKMAQILIKQYPKYYTYFSKQDFTYMGVTYHNHNKLLGKYRGMDGLKTGYIQASGFNLIASAVRNNRRIIGVVFGGHTAQTRNARMIELLDRGFGKINEIRIANADVPVPPHKPGILLAFAHLKALNPAAADKNETMEVKPSRWASLSNTLQNGMFGELIGEGDSDPGATRRIETGMMAIAAHRHEKPSLKNFSRNLHLASFSPDSKNSFFMAPPETTGSWAIQIGAFKSRAKIDETIKQAYLDLPQKLRESNPVIVPLKTSNGWLFRGRLTGYTKSQARLACKYIEECMPISPSAR